MTGYGRPPPEHWLPTENAGEALDLSQFLTSPEGIAKARLEATVGHLDGWNRTSYRSVVRPAARIISDVLSNHSLQRLLPNGKRA